jgi:hypothetical protein
VQSLAVQIWKNGGNGWKSEARGAQLHIIRNFT